MTNARLRFLAKRAVGPTTLRSSVPPGSRAKVIEFLISMPLPQADDFCGWLKHQTDDLAKRICSEDQRVAWGPARKSINLYLRDLANDRLEGVGISRIRSELELPLDSTTMKWLKLNQDSKLPITTIRNLDIDVSQKFQSAAKMAAAKRRMTVVDLDFEIWGVL